MVYVVPFELGHRIDVFRGEVEVDIILDVLLRALVLVLVLLSPGSKIAPVGKSAVGNDDSDDIIEGVCLLMAVDVGSVEVKDDAPLQTPGGTGQMK